MLSPALCHLIIQLLPPRMPIAINVLSLRSFIYIPLTKVPSSTQLKISLYFNSIYILILILLLPSFILILSTDGNGKKKMASQKGISNYILICVHVCSKTSQWMPKPSDDTKPCIYFFSLCIIH